MSWKIKPQQLYWCTTKGHEEVWFIQTTSLKEAHKENAYGIRHALMDDTAEYVPGAEEALFMLVSCSAFINYLNSKKI